MPREKVELQPREEVEPQPQEETPSTYIATNLSSRSFLFGDVMIMPKIPVQVDEPTRQTILNSKYGEFFQFEKEEPPPPP